MLFVISVVFAVLGFFMTFFGITYSNFTNHPARVKWLKWGLGICLLISIVFAYLETESDKEKNETQRHTIERMNVIDSISQIEIVRLREESRKYNEQLAKSNQSHADSLRSYHKEDILQIQSTAYNMTKIFGQESKYNAQQHQKTQFEISKIDTTKLKSAHISFIPEPVNCFLVSYAANALNMTVHITNSGDRIAYNLSWTANVVLEGTDGKFYRYPTNPLPKYGYDMPSNVDRSMELKRPLSDAAYAEVKSIYVIVNGYYYDNESLKNKKEFLFAGKHEMNDPALLIYNLDKEIMTFYNEAKEFQFEK